MTEVRQHIRGLQKCILPALSLGFMLFKLSSGEVRQKFAFSKYFFPLCQQKRTKKCIYRLQWWHYKRINPPTDRCQVIATSLYCLKGQPYLDSAIHRGRLKNVTFLIISIQCWSQQAIMDWFCWLHLIKGLLIVPLCVIVWTRGNENQWMRWGSSKAK